MCRFLLYMGPSTSLESLITQPENSLVHQSYKSKERKEALNGDGFGVAWYVGGIGPVPGLFRSISPAWNNANLKNLSRVTVGHCVLAHVRAASPGLPVTETNCHPFTAGTLSFMHNGAVSGFRCLKRALIGQLTDDAFNAIEGTTDSEYVFALFRSLLQTRGAAEKEHVSVDDMARALGQAIRIVSEIVSEAGIEDETRLNLVASDGRQAVISRYARKPEIAESLYVCQDRQYVVEEGRSRLVHPAPGEESVIVSSERLSEDEGWSPVPLNHMVLIDPDLNVRIEALDL